MSFTQVVPRLRRDIDIITTGEAADQMLILRDSYGYAEEPIAIPVSAWAILELLDGTSTIEEIQQKALEELGATVDAQNLEEFIVNLDLMGYLESALYFDRKLRLEQEFNHMPVRKAACAGSSYPKEPEKLTAFLDKVLKNVDTSNISGNAVGALIPHIDLRVGAETYAPAYHAIKNTDADLFVVIGTSHYGWQDQYILTEKDFETPLGIVKTDRELIHKIREALPFKPTPNDIAHKPEHSLEFQFVFLKHLLKDKNFTVLPILVTSFNNFVDEEQSPREDEKVREFARVLKEVVVASGRKSVWIASGDLAHIGKKFGDEFPAETMLEMVRAEDEELLDSLREVDAESFFNKIAAIGDERRICGLPPLYTMLEALKPSKAEVLQYKQWNEKETESAVTFASVAFYK
ncbi:MAG TPA: AmmeMemoRadiSam system protein B [Patescibacteria group bacterium]|nr:AmmeMemoRadiSam system protein B [Patescibacteria group bacterium]